MVAGHPGCRVVIIRSGAVTEDHAGSYIITEDAPIHHSCKDEVPGDGGSGSCRLESVYSMSGGEGGQADQGEQRWHV